MPETGQYVGSLAVLSVAALCLLVGGVGAVALLAEFDKSWTAYHFMERTVAQSAPVAVALVAATVVTAFLAVFRSG